MNKFFRRLGISIGTLLIVALLMPMTAFAAGYIDPDQSAELNIHYIDEGKALPGAQFSIYRIADIDKYSQITVNETFAPYIKEDLTTYGQDEWAALASTLKGYVARDEITASMTETTDPNGELVVTAQPGLYLVVGNRVTTRGHYTYTATPFIVQLPGKEADLNMWDYSVDVYPKYLKEHFSSGDDTSITRKVLKIWDDKGYESIRPENVTVQLLCDGTVQDTVTLNKENNWRFAWDNLSPEHEWLVVEKEQGQYAVTTTQQGVTFTITNKYIAPIIREDPPVQKRILGDKPENPASFTFILTAKDGSYPMPAGSNGTTKEITIKGAGSEEFGEIVFTKPGKYAYTVSEKNDGITGYTYDKTIYTITYTVEQKDGELSVSKTISDNNNSEVSVVEFTNNYKIPGNKLPQTGQLWWPIPMLLVTGCSMVIGGIVLRSKRKDEE